MYRAFKKKKQKNNKDLQGSIYSFNGGREGDLKRDQMWLHF